MEKHHFVITRRRLLKATGALAGVSAMGGLSPAFAQSGGRVVVGTWGGDYSKLLSKNIDTPLMVPKKYEVVHDIGGDSERRAKMRAEARLPRGTSDLQGLSAPQMFEMNEAGLCLPVDYAKIPNAQYLHAADEISVRRRTHLLGQGHSLQPEAHQRRRPRASPTRSIRSTATSSASSTSSIRTR